MAGPFASNGGGAAFGNPSITQQGLKGGATQVGGGAGRGSYAGYDAKADQASKAKAAAANSKKPGAANSDSKPMTQPALAPASSGGTFVFPKDFPSQYSLVMKFGPYRRQVALENKLVDHDLFIMLPMPANLGESFGATYNSAALGPFGGELAKGVSGMASDIGAGKDWLKSLTDTVTSGIRRANNDGTLTATLLSQATKGSEALNLGVNMMFGMTPNPNLAVGFQGVPLRTYSFSWKFAPTSADESQTLIDIIFHLKQRMHPLKEGFALRYPDYCNVSVHSNTGTLHDLIKFKTSVLVDMKVNYAPSGVPSFFAKTQTPTEMEISLTFHETEVFTRVDFENIPKIGAVKADY